MTSAGDGTTTTARHSLWLADLEPRGRADDSARRSYAAVSADERFDVAVLGAGIAGLTCALFLRRAGLRVAVIEAARVGAGVSGNNTAKASALQGTAYSTIASRHGASGARDYAAASMLGVRLLAELAADEQIDCQLESRPAYTFAYTPAELSAVKKEAAAAREAGVDIVFEEQSSLDVPFPTYGAVRLDDQLCLHPYRYCQGLAAAVNRDGSRVFEQSRVRAVRDGAPCRIETDGGTITADRVVVATHYPILDRGLYFARLHTTRAYCVAARLTTGEPPRGLAISAGQPTWSISHHQGSAGDFLIVCGASHATGRRDGHSSADAYQQLAAFAREYWDIDEITHRWSAQDATSYDELPMIGPYVPGSKRMFVATGFRKWGLATATFAGQLITQLLTGSNGTTTDRGPNARIDATELERLATRFSPHRVTLNAVGTLVSTNAAVATDFVRDRLTPADHSTSDDLPAGQAQVVRDGLAKVGIYRDDDGELHGVSLRCTHLGCLLRFNAAETSWDCSCHGSRFDVDGSVLEGPATRPLPRRLPGKRSS